VKHDTAVLLVAIATACTAARSRPRAPSNVGCLPAGVRSTDTVSAERVGPVGRLVILTVAQRLRQLGASCRGDTLVDSSARPIRFYRLHCFGAPTTYALETLRRERAELDSLRRRYTVVGMTCSPTGEPTP
jgi:hypothetical protein